MKIETFRGDFEVLEYFPLYSADENFNLKSEMIWVMYGKIFGEYAFYEEFVDIIKGHPPSFSGESVFIFEDTNKIKFDSLMNMKEKYAGEIIYEVMWDIYQQKLTFYNSDKEGLSMYMFSEGEAEELLSFYGGVCMITPYPSSDLLWGCSIPALLNALNTYIPSDYSYNKVKLFISKSQIFGTTKEVLLEATY